MITLGVDVGSHTAKCVILRDDRLLAWDLILTGPDSVETATRVTGNVLETAGLALEDLGFIVATGYGRVVVPFAHRNVSEISCHAKGANWFFPSARTILDMGGQDCKAIRCDGKGKVTDFVMNDKCAAGAGRSMGVVAELLNIPLHSLGELSLQADGDGVPISSTCVVFARSEILSLLRRGTPKPDVLAGACQALSKRVLALLKRIGIEKDLVVSGGIAKNVGVVRRLEKAVGTEARICFEPQIIGALGAAIFARDFLRKREATGR